MEDTTLARPLCALAALFVLGCGTTPPPNAGPNNTYEVADVGVYTGGWHGGPRDAGGSVDGEPGPTLTAGETDVGQTASGALQECAAGSGCGRATFTSTYCGGAAPPYDLITQLATPKALGSTTFVVRPGAVHDPSQPETARVSTNEDGWFSRSEERRVGKEC